MYGDIDTEENNAAALLPYMTDLAVSFSSREAIGSLMYITTCNGPDFGYEVGSLAQSCEKPTLAHWKTAKRVFHNLCDTQTTSMV